MLNFKDGRLLRRSKSEDEKMIINILLCDDNQEFLQKLADMVAQQPLPKGEKVSIFQTTHAGDLTDRQLTQYQVMFLDIDMGERSGMDVARRVRQLQLSTVIVFVTNYPQFSIEGYEVRAFRYLLKQELEEKLPSYFRDAIAELPKRGKKLQFVVNSERYSVPYEDILYLASDRRIIYLYTVRPISNDGGDHFYGKLDDLTKELEKEGFLRIQKSYLVNMAHIKKMNYDHVVLSNGKELSVSRKGYSEIKIRYLGWKNAQWG